ncbi:Ligand-binding SRPBCC domain-containing protein [Psychrobacillus sp. OK028]|uniref:SRPBCC family protein n=1 Tax=Psychrobacillus sp. OK028 TaxID=1884359 RepID=UPI00088D3C9D|nr:SRPBCC family protein [Psychrobacillus sp. OK028]SDN71879.1 Ligand-binding SRPBCC domain-containing protein [Psychrobacillus sp. OK028]
MPKIVHKQIINAPIEICFDLARNVEVHTKTTTKTNEKAVAGVTTGLLKEGDTVTWEATHFSIRQKLTAKIVCMDRPNQFKDTMIKGAFHSFIHTHDFIEVPEGTLMIDTFDYKSPLGILGVLADKLFLERYMREFIISRSIELKKIAEQER